MAVQRLAGPGPQAMPMAYTPGLPAAQAQQAAAFPAATIIQREAEPAPAPVEPAPVERSAPAAAESAAPPAPAFEPEELLKTLYDPLVRRLKTELRLDRERLGLITDL